MGVVKYFQILEAGDCDLSWSQIKAVLKALMLEFPDTVTWNVLDIIEKREGKGPCGIEWWEIRRMLEDLTDIYYADMDLRDLYGQIAHMSGRDDSLADKVEDEREHTEFQRLLDKDD